MRLRSLVLSFGLIWVGFQSIESVAQIIINSSTQLSTIAATKIAFNSNITVNGGQADLSKATLILTGDNQNLTNGNTGSPVVLGGLIVGETVGAKHGTKSIFGGAWEIAGSLIFNDGVVVPQSGSNGKLIHTIPNGVPSSIQVNNPESFVNGTFYSKGAGTRIFPIGNSVGYFPSQLFNVTQSDVEIGMRAISSDPALTHGTELLEIFKDHYWEIIDPTSTLAGPLAGVSSLGSESFVDPTVGTVIVGAPTLSGAATILGGSLSKDFFIGSNKIQTTDRILTLAKISSDQVQVKIHNVITPFLDNANDYLEIENIDIFPDNKVMLLDRWGVKVKEWSGFKNVSDSPNSSQDLSKITTGNYICIVEYKDGSAVKKLSQMITVINQ